MLKGKLMLRGCSMQDLSPGARQDGEDEAAKMQREALARTSRPPRPHCFAIRTLAPSRGDRGDEEANITYHDVAWSSFEKSLFKSRGLRDAENHTLEGLVLVCPPDDDAHRSRAPLPPP